MRGLIPLPTNSKPSKSISMRKLTATICLTFTILLGSIGVSASADFQKGLTAAQRGYFATALREWKPLAKHGDARAQSFVGRYTTKEKVFHRITRLR